MGIKPDIIVLRCDEPLEREIFKKISLFCNVKENCVIQNTNVPILYEAPIMLEESNFSNVVCEKLKITAPPPKLDEWNTMLSNIANRDKTVNIGIVGKYVQLHDAYLSVAEAVRHAGYECRVNTEILWIDSEEITDRNAAEKLKDCDGIIVPGGFGSRGIPGMISAAKFARENDLPYLGICLGMQIAVIEFARSVCGLADADSREFNELSPNKVIDFMPDQSSDIDKGGTLRLGAYRCKVKKGTRLYDCFGQDEISERHRHRYEFNNDYKEILSENGLTVSGTSPDGSIVETVEVGKNRFYVGVQFHPEFKSRPNKAHPLFKGLVEAAVSK